MNETLQQAPRPRVQATNWAKEIMSTLVFLVAVFTLLQLAMPRSIVHGSSMEPSFEEGERLVISRLSYLFGDPQRGDIVVFNSPSPLQDNEPPLIKRIIGMPGDTVELRSQQLYINNELVEEPYVNDPECRPTKCRDNVWELGEEEYFVMGDNRNVSRDSRSFGKIARDNIIGEALIRFWPLQSIGTVDHYRFPSEE